MKFVRAIFPMLIVLRLADQKEPVMDKLYFYVRRMDKTLEISKGILDDLEERAKAERWPILVNTYDCDVDSDESNDDSVNDEGDDSEEEESDNNVPAEPVCISLGSRVRKLWQKRRPKLVTDLSIAGWLFSPIADIHQDATKHMNGEHRDAVERLLKRMYGGDLPEDSTEYGSIVNTFWSEFDTFRKKLVPFQKPHIWNESNQDLALGHAHRWHAKNSYYHTTYFGKLACRVCSKIVGMGSAERNWGDVKHLKSSKRSHLSTERTEKQATIFGASCMADAALERQKVQETSVACVKFWDESDFNSQFDLLAEDDSLLPTAKKRVVKCYFEDWELTDVRSKDIVSQAKLLRKYGGLEFDDIDNGDHYTIDGDEMQWHRVNGWMVKAYKKGDDKEDWTPFVISPNAALFDCLFLYYNRHPAQNITAITLAEHRGELADWAHDLPDPSNTAPQPNELTARTEQPPSSRRRGTPLAKVLTNTQPVPTVTTRLGSKTNHRPPNKNNSVQPDSAGDGVLRCGGCGGVATLAHQCDVCFCPMHVICGHGIGEEGYGQKIRCPSCQDKENRGGLS